MEETDHVLLTATGAEAFAKKLGLPMVNNSALISEKSRKALDLSNRNFSETIDRHYTAKYVHLI
jgi:isoaspartyl peptidase/L-asparaginase-like protein (Ntn-hydrolase superfamily)